MSWLAVGIGGAIGSMLRWKLGVFMNHLHTHLPLGTLLVNCLGGYLIGLAVAFFNQSAALSPEWRLLVITGFLGGLTTFSTFSAEAVLFLQRGEYLWMLAHSLLHLIGSILFCILGFACFRFFAAS